MERAVAGQESVEVEVVRYGELIKLQLTTAARDGSRPERLLGWAGTLIQDVPVEVCQQHGTDATGVYVSAHMPGSPVTRSNLHPTSRIVAVDGQPVTSLDDFAAAVKEKTDQKTAVRVRSVTLDGQERMSTVPLDSEFWKTYKVECVDGQWQRTEQ